MRIRGGGSDEEEGRNGVLGGFDLDLECEDEGNQQATVAGTNDEEEVTLPPASDLVNGIKSVGSSIKSGKTKNSSNKKKERMSMAGAIVKLIEQGQPAGRSLRELSANMSMMLMRHWIA